MRQNFHNRKDKNKLLDRQNQIWSTMFSFLLQTIKKC